MYTHSQIQDGVYVTNDRCSCPCKITGVSIYVIFQSARIARHLCLISPETDLCPRYIILENTK